MKRNIEKINQLADRIEECEEVEISEHTMDMELSFSMNFHSYSCGYPACIAGHLEVMQGRKYGTSLDVARDLGISVRQADELSCPAYSHASFSHIRGQRGFITKDHAVAVLRNLRDTGEVDWQIGKSP